MLEPVDDRYAYRDLVAAREASRLLARGIELRQILEAAVALRRRGHHLAETRLTEGPSGELVRELSGQLAELSGQLTMPLDCGTRSIDELVAAAESAEETGDLATAESLYTTALRADANDPVLPFNLGNVFAAQGRPAEAKIAWQIAVAREPAFAEAWYNLAMAAEDEEQIDLADRPIPPRGAGAARLCRRPLQSRAVADETGPLRRGPAAVGSFSGARTQRPAGEDGKTCGCAVPHAHQARPGQGRVMRSSIHAASASSISLLTSASFRPVRAGTWKE